MAHPSAQLYTDSAVRLGAATGTLRWYYQAVPNDFKDYDMQASPTRARIGRVALAVKVAGPARGEVEALNLTSGKVEWDTKVAPVPLGAATVSKDLIFTTLVNRTLIAVNRRTSAIAYQRKLPTTTNSPIAIAGRTVRVPGGGIAGKARSRNPQLVAYVVRSGNSP